MSCWPVPQSRIISLAQVAIQAFFTQQGDQFLRDTASISEVTIGFYLGEGGSFMGVSSRLFEESSSEVAMRVFLFVTQRVPFSTKKGS